MTSLGATLNKEINIPIDSASLLQIGRGLHRTHKNQRMRIESGSYLYYIYLDKAREMCIKKSTQSGISEYLICRSINRAMKGKTILYVLPTFSLKGQFVQERVDKTILFTPFYTDLLKQNGNQQAESTSIKQINAGSIVYTGSNTSVAFVSYPADDIIIDELNECSEEYLPMAEERQAASTDKTTVNVGNPTISNKGIDLKYNESDKKIWEIECSSCGQWIHPDFFKHVVRQVEEDNWLVLDKDYDEYNGKDIRPVCHLCGKPFDRYASGVWTPQNKSDVSGYHISQMFSSTVTIKEMLKRFKDGLSDDTIMQRFYNGNLGLSYTSKGAKIDVDMLEAITKDYNMLNKTSHPTVAGIDVGTLLHIMISEVYESKLRVVFIGTVRTYEEVIELFRKYNVKCFVVDAMPETRLSRRLVNNWFGLACTISGSSNREIGFNLPEKTMTAQRTAMLDAVKESIMIGTTALPANARTIDGFFEQMTCSTRVYDEKKEAFVWEHGSVPDHYFFSFAFMLLARRTFVMAMSKQQEK